MAKYYYYAPPGSVVLDGATGKLLVDTKNHGGFTSDDLRDAAAGDLIERANRVFPQASILFVQIYEWGERTTGGEAWAQDENGVVYEARETSYGYLEIYLTPGHYTVWARLNCNTADPQEIEVMPDENEIVFRFQEEE